MLRARNAALLTVLSIPPMSHGDATASLLHQCLAERHVQNRPVGPTRHFARTNSLLCTNEPARPLNRARDATKGTRRDHPHAHKNTRTNSHPSTNEPGARFAKRTNEFGFPCEIKQMRFSNGALAPPCRPLSRAGTAAHGALGQIGADTTAMPGPPRVRRRARARGLLEGAGYDTSDCEQRLTRPGSPSRRPVSAARPAATRSRPGSAPGGTASRRKVPRSRPGTRPRARSRYRR